MNEFRVLEKLQMRLVTRDRASRLARAGAVLLTLALALLAAGPVAANGKPIQIVLAYQPGLSTWGPQNATGVAELVLAEGEVRLAVTGLPVLEQDRYTVWLLKSRSSEALALGSFNVEPSGSTRVDRVLPAAIPDRGWDTLLLSVEPVDSTPAAPGPRRSIAGSFPQEQTGAGPQQLPRTGGPSPEPGAGAPPVPWPLLGLGGGGLLAAGLLAGLWLAGARRPKTTERP